MIQAVLFDMDGLLINSEPLWRQAEKEVFSLVNITLTDEMCFQTVGLRIDEVVAFWFEKFPWNNIPQASVKEKIVNRVIELVNEKGSALPGVYSVMDFFTSRNIPMGIASASDEKIIHAVVEQLQIKKFLQIIHSAEHETHGKPHPAVYLTAAQKLKVKPWHCLVFEDSFNGVIAAKAARMKVIAVPEDIHFGELHFHAADYTLQSLTAFNETLWNKLQS